MKRLWITTIASLILLVDTALISAFVASTRRTASRRRKDPDCEAHRRNNRGTKQSFMRNQATTSTLLLHANSEDDDTGCSKISNSNIESTSGDNADVGDKNAAKAEVEESPLQMPSPWIVIGATILFVSFWPTLAYIRLHYNFDIDTYLTLQGMMEPDPTSATSNTILELPNLSPGERLLDISGRKIARLLIRST